MEEKMPQGKMRGALRCGLGGGTVFVTMEPVAWHRLKNRVEPIPLCPVCEEDCSPNLLRCEVPIDAGILIHTDERSGGYWAPGFSFKAHAGPPVR